MSFLRYLGQVVNLVIVNSVTLTFPMHTVRVVGPVFGVAYMGSVNDHCDTVDGETLWTGTFVQWTTPTIHTNVVADGVYNILYSAYLALGDPKDTMERSNPTSSAG